MTRLLPVAIVLAGLALQRDKPERAWTSSGFRESLSRAAEEARVDLVASPDVDWADVRVRSEADHAPLKVEVTLDRPVSEGRRDSLKALVKSRFDSFARVEVDLR